MQKILNTFLLAAFLITFLPRAALADRSECSYRPSLGEYEDVAGRGECGDHFGTRAVWSNCILRRTCHGDCGPDQEAVSNIFISMTATCLPDPDTRTWRWTRCWTSQAAIQTCGTYWGICPDITDTCNNPVYANLAMVNFADPEWLTGCDGGNVMPIPDVASIASSMEPKHRPHSDFPNLEDFIAGYASLTPVPAPTEDERVQQSQDFGACGADNVPGGVGGVKVW